MADTLPTPREHYPTLIDALVAGAHQTVDGDPIDIDDEVEAWHVGGDQSHGELHAYLGMTWDEYARWASDPDSLDTIVAERRAAIDGPQDGRLVTRFGVDSNAQVSSFANATISSLGSGHAMSVALTPPSDFPVGHPTIARGLLDAAFRRLLDLGWRVEIEAGPDLDAETATPRAGADAAPDPDWEREPRDVD